MTSVAVALAAGEVYENLPVGAELKHRVSGKTIRVNVSRGTEVIACYIRRDGYPDGRHATGWAGSLRKDEWRVTFPKKARVKYGA